MRHHIKPAKCMVYITSILVVLMSIYPVFWILMTSFKTIDEQQGKSPFALPSSLYLQNFINAFAGGRLGTYYKNSIIVAVVTIVAIVLLSATAAFAIEKMKFKFSSAVMGFFLLGIAIPIHITLIPMFQIYRNMNLLNSYLSLILPQIGFALPISIYLFTAFYKYLPNSLMEAAIIDGASVGKCFWKVYLPLSKNTIVTVATMNLIGIWNEFIFANTFVSSIKMKTLPVGLYDFVGERGRVDWGSTFSAISVSLIPVLVIYFILNKNIIAGMTAGAVKE